MNTGTSDSPVEYVLGLRAEDKSLVLTSLLKELIALHDGGKCLIPIQTPDGESLGYYVPPAAMRAEVEQSEGPGRPRTARRG